MISGAVQRSHSIYLTAKENPGKSQLRNRQWRLCVQLSPQIGSLPSKWGRYDYISTSGSEKEGKDRVDVMYSHGLWNLETQCSIYKGSPIIHILRQINSIPRIVTYFLNIHFNIFHPSCLPKSLFPVGLPVKILKALIPSSILTTWCTHLNLSALCNLFH